jgi:lysophospholipase L1-like esterase
MKKLILRVIFFVICLEIFFRLGGLVTSVGQSLEGKAKLKNGQAFRIMCVGDSTTAIGGEDSYPNLLQAILTKRHPVKAIEVINRGLPIGTSQMIVDRFEKDIETYKPDMVVFMVGINDVQVGIKEEHALPWEQLRLVRALKVIWTHVTHQENKEPSKQVPDAMPEENYPAKEAYLRNAIAQVPPQAAMMKLPMLDQLAGALLKQRKFEEAEAIWANLLALTADDKDNRFTIWGSLVELFVEKNDIENAHKAFINQVMTDPQRIGVYEKIVNYHRAREQYGQLQDFLDGIVTQMPHGYHRGLLQIALGDVLLDNRNYQKALDVYKDVARREYDAPVGIFEHAERGIHLAQHGGIMPSQDIYYNKDTIKNLKKLKNMADSKGLISVFVQYPMRPIEPLKAIFSNQKILFVDNGPSFRQAVAQKHYDFYFEDHYGADFGHCTLEGRKLLAHNVADVISNEVFHEHF